MFTKILIANRGEIACRVIKTARRWASPPWPCIPKPTATRATWSWPTRPCCIGPAPSRESYLVADTHHRRLQGRPAPQAVHPGYGFLSENEEFARRVEEPEGHRLHRPEAHSDRGDGRQDRLEEAGRARPRKVNTIPGYNDRPSTRPSRR
jgi:propionyl-CoA carboxylase alpha chain